MCDKDVRITVQGLDERAPKKAPETCTQLYRRYIAVLKRIGSYKCFCSMSAFHKRIELTQEEQKEVAEHEAKEKIVHLQSVRAKLTENEMKALVEDIRERVKVELIKGIQS